MFDVRCKSVSNELESVDSVHDLLARGLTDLPGMQPRSLLLKELLAQRLNRAAAGLPISRNPPGDEVVPFQLVLLFGPIGIAPPTEVIRGAVNFLGPLTGRVGPEGEVLTRLPRSFGTLSHLAIADRFGTLIIGSVVLVSLFGPCGILPEAKVLRLPPELAGPLATRVRVEWVIRARFFRFFPTKLGLSMFGFAVAIQFGLLAVIAVLRRAWVIPRPEVVQLALNFLRPLAVGMGEEGEVGTWFGRSLHVAALACGSGSSVVDVEAAVAVPGVKPLGTAVVSRVSGCMVGVVRLPQVSEKVNNHAFSSRKTHVRP